MNKKSIEWLIFAVDKRGRRLTKNKVKEDIKSKSVSPKKSNKILDISTSVPVEPLESCSSDKTGYHHFYTMYFPQIFEVFIEVLQGKVKCFRERIRDGNGIFS